MVDTRFAYEETFDCVQCGYCLPACPTYLSMEKETHSPRGRINLVKMAAEGKITYGDLEAPINLCLGCRACEVVCPTNVQYGKILESAKEVLQEEKSKRSKLFQEFAFGKALPNKTAQSMMNTGLTIYQKTGLHKVAQKSGALKLLPERLRSFESILPKVERNKRETFYPAKKSTYHVGFFTGCMMDSMFASINTKSIKLLQAAGCNVTIIQEQTCCGALQSHAGETEIAKQLAKENIEAFEKYDFDFIVNSIGGCGAMLIEYDQLFKDDALWEKRAKRFVEKIADISVVLSNLSLSFKKEINRIVTYQPSCHMTNVQKVIEPPLTLLQSIPGIRYIELPNKNMCCGSAGIYNLVNYEASMEILDKKMENFHQVTQQPTMIVTTNPGCHLQMKLGVEREGKSAEIEVVHLVELLAEACGIGD